MKNNVKYLVTGAAGFLGGTICRQLIERGENVRAFVLPGDPAMKYVPREARMPAHVLPARSAGGIRYRPGIQPLR